MRAFLNAVKRVLVGDKIATHDVAPRTLPARIAIPVFGIGVLSAVAYAPDAVVSALASAGQEDAIPAVAVGVVLIMVLIGFAYRSNVIEFGGKRGDYGVVSAGLGRGAGVVTGAALMVDYVLTMAVSVAAIAAAARFFFPEIAGYEDALGVGIIGVLTLTALRGAKERAVSLAIVWGGFLFTAFGTVVFGFALHGSGAVRAAGEAPAPSTLTVAIAYGGAIAAGAVMVTGVEHLAASGRYHAEPRGPRVGRTVVVAVLVAAAMFMAVAVLAWEYRADGWESGPLVLQIASDVFRTSIPVWILGGATVAVLVAAAVGVFRRFAELSSALSKDRFLPRQLHTLNDRNVHAGGVLIMSAASVIALVAARGDLDRLIHVFIVGVFASIVLTQVAMVRVLGQRLGAIADRRERVGVMVKRALHLITGLVALAVWLIVVVFNVASGAWIAVLAMVLLVWLMWGINRHYRDVSQQVSPVKGDRASALPSATHGIVLISQLHRPALRTLAYARAARHDSLTAVAVQVDKRDAERLREQWGKADLGVRLTTLDSPYRDSIGPIITYVRTIRRASPREMIVVYVPEYIVSKKWHRLLHNKIAARLRERLLQIPGVVVTAVPWHLTEAKAATLTARE